MIPWDLIRILWTSFLVSKMYLVLVYGVLQDWPHTAANAVAALGFAYLVSKIKS